MPGCQKPNPIGKWAQVGAQVSPLGGRSTIPSQGMTIPPKKNGKNHGQAYGYTPIVDACRATCRKHKHSTKYVSGSLLLVLAQALKVCSPSLNEIRACANRPSRAIFRPIVFNINPHGMHITWLHVAHVSSSLVQVWWGLQAAHACIFCWCATCPNFFIEVCIGSLWMPQSHVPVLNGTTC